MDKEKDDPSNFSNSMFLDVEEDFLHSKGGCFDLRYKKGLLKSADWREYTDGVLVMDGKGYCGDTALMEASKHGNKTIVESLLSRKEIEEELRLFAHEDMGEIMFAQVDVNAQNKCGKTALMYAARWAREDIAEMLLAQGADPNLKDEDGWTALTRSTIWGNKEISRMLLAHGANPSPLYNNLW